MTGVVPSLPVWALVWLAIALFLVVRHWRTGVGVGLTLAYVASFGSIQWLGSLMYLAPWYIAPGGDLVAEGMRQSALALLAFAIGGEIAAWLFAARHPRVLTFEETLAGPPLEFGEDVFVASPVSPAAANLYLGAGLVLYGVVAPLAGRVPTLAALVNTGSTLIVAGICVKCWNAWQCQNMRTMAAWIGLSFLLPFITVLTQGFLGYGLAALVTVCAFTAAFYGPRWKVIAAALGLTYIGLSVYVTYMRDRGEIRAVVWNRGAVTDRFDQVAQTATEFEWFDPYNTKHLARMDSRLNQNFLVGAAVVYLNAGNVPYAHGATIIDAAYALVPRALWPEKPMTAGSGDLVSIYTGITFAEDTSVGIGQVMECYVNFGTAGVIGGFLLIGVLVVLCDRFAERRLEEGDVGKFGVWYLPGLSLLLVGGSFVEVTSSAAAALVVAAVLDRVTRRLPEPVRMSQDRPVTGVGDMPELHL